MSRIAFIALAAFAMVPTQVGAQAYTDEAAWRAAVGNVYALETFDTTAAGSDVTSLPALNLSFLPLNDATQPTVQAYSFTGGQVQSGPNNLLNDRDQSLPARGPIQVVPLTPGEFLYGLGLWNVGGDDQLLLSFYDASDNLLDQVTSAPSFGFFGLVNTAGATRAQISFVGGNGYAPTDDWQTAVRTTFVPQPSGVPEPTTWAMMLLGFGAVGYSIRRKRKLDLALAA